MKNCKQCYRSKANQEDLENGMVYQFHSLKYGQSKRIQTREFDFSAK